MRIRLPRHIVHRIITDDENPVRAKVRRILPGSPKAIKVLQALQNLEKLGIIERVNPGDPNNWSSPVHFTVKEDGTLRCVGDYRLCNKKTILDLFPLPNLRSFTGEIAGCTIFSKMDLTKALHQIKIDP